MLWVVFGVAAVLVLLVVGATLFRAAVALANAVLGPQRMDASLAWDWEAAEDEGDFEELRRRARAIPEPGLGQGMLILFAAGMVQLLIGVVTEGLFDLDGREFGDPDEWLPPHLLGLALGYAVTTGIVSSMLPTTVRRAAVATLFFYLITLLIAGLIVGVIAFVLGSLR